MEEEEEGKNWHLSKTTRSFLFARCSKTIIVFLTLGWKNKSRIAIIFALAENECPLSSRKQRGKEMRVV